VRNLRLSSGLTRMVSNMGESNFIVVDYEKRSAKRQGSNARASRMRNRR
jgi:hypothetical protein